VQVSRESDHAASIASLLDQLEGARAVTVVPAVRRGHSVATATIQPVVLDGLLQELPRRGVPREDITVTRAEAVGQPASTRAAAGIAWSDALGSAWRRAHPSSRYLVYMFVAGVIACYGVTDDSSILIVGAMAVSPDLLPLVALAVGIIGRNSRLVRGASLTLVVGFALAALAAAIFGFAQNQLDLISSGFNLHRTGVLGGLVHVNDETIVIAFVAGAAGMLAFETGASSAVGVGISAAYLGVAAGLGETAKAFGALAVLGTNLVMMAIGASLVLWIQRRRETVKQDVPIALDAE
jgi:hypothetical protein